ncbi:chemotaxis protein CheX [Legionella rowbothamii]|uniref:chemotaxis protein CheX n=1 Tax=Legionella rowbothamii TaxID=96229 RepID=UPI00105477FB|nr:chemotaxis protein CheX [Legionella rowbothamii]
MSIASTPEIWLTAAVDAVNDFVINGLGDQDTEVFSLEYSRIQNPNQLSGSYLMLDCGTYQVEVGLLVDLENLNQITRKMLSLSSKEKLDKEQMSDVLNESINIISGGIKSRLNDHIEGGITLGLPRFLKNTEESRKIAILLQYVSIGDLRLSISVSIM